MLLLGTDSLQYDTKKPGFKLLLLINIIIYLFISRTLFHSCFPVNQNGSTQSVGIMYVEKDKCGAAWAAFWNVSAVTCTWLEGNGVCPQHLWLEAVMWWVS